MYSFVYMCFIMLLSHCNVSVHTKRLKVVVKFANLSLLTVPEKEIDFLFLHGCDITCHANCLNLF